MKTVGRIFVTDKPELLGGREYKWTGPREDLPSGTHELVTRESAETAIAQAVEAERKRCDAMLAEAAK